MEQPTGGVASLAQGSSGPRGMASLQQGTGPGGRQTGSRGHPPHHPFQKMSIEYIFPAMGHGKIF